MKTLIVGSGICGLWLARQMEMKTPGSVLVLEKARGVGGRLATRRSESSRWDHGAQFYSLRDSLEEAHAFWQSQNLGQSWFERDGNWKFKSSQGMTNLAKALAQKTQIKMDAKVTSLKYVNSHWEISVENGDNLQAEQVILTCPLPQSLDLLRRSEISFDPKLLEITYAKALVALYEKVSLAHQWTGPFGYREFPPNDEIFSISDQSAKGLCPDKAITVCMSPAFSEKSFDREDEFILEKIKQVLKEKDPDFVYQTVQLKKWRFAFPLSKFTQGFANPAPDLYLAGDAFGGPSISGAAASANSLWLHLKNKSPN